mmetsp:Transcript_34798/g.46185  ORF Transcript_34798/g.46185 Transcript_34798/m.46185 type:complete len:259 (-) Transcript_34798:51-827(-)
MKTNVMMMMMMMNPNDIMNVHFPIVVEGNNDDDDDDDGNNNHEEDENAQNDNDEVDPFVAMIGMAPVAPAAPPQPMEGNHIPNNNNINPTTNPGIFVKYEILRLDSTTFMVATRYTSDDIVVPPCLMNQNGVWSAERKTLERHGQLLFQVLRRRFPTQEIITLKEYLKQQEHHRQLDQRRKDQKEEEEEEKEMGVNGRSHDIEQGGESSGGVLQNVMARIWNTLGMGFSKKKKRDEDDEFLDGRHDIKRRRIDGGIHV